MVGSGDSKSLYDIVTTEELLDETADDMMIQGSPEQYSCAASSLLMDSDLIFERGEPNQSEIEMNTRRLREKGGGDAFHAPEVVLVE